MNIEAKWKKKRRYTNIYYNTFLILNIRVKK